MLAVVVTAKQFACRPSALMAIEDPVMALAFDLAACKRALEMERGDSEPAEQICL